MGRLFAATWVPSMSDTDNQRAFERVLVNKDFESIDEFVSEYVTNISRSGVFIRSKNPLPAGTEVDLRFSILSDDFQMIKGVGKVVRVTETGMGVVFTKLDEESQAYVSTLTPDDAFDPEVPPEDGKTDEPSDPEA